MENPVVVFLDPTSAHGAGNLIFPIGWTSAGERLCGAAAIKDKECCMILLDDSAPVPSCDHANKKTGQTLLVVIHQNSILHNRAQIVSNLALWGKVNVIGEFSHTKIDATFAEMKELLGNPALASGFAKKRGNSAILDLLDQLATICQICIIQPTAEVKQEWTALTTTMNTLDKAFVRALHIAPGYPEQLALLNEKATSLSH